MTEISPLAKLLCDFCFSTIKGHESGLYKGFKAKMIGEYTVDILRTSSVIPMIQGITVNYLNKAYVSLIKRDDPYIIKHFDEMCKVNNHSVICLLNIIMMFITNIHLSLDRLKLDITSYETYMKCIMEQLDSKFKESLDIINKCISHTCTGVDIKTCNPNEPLFHFS